MRGRRGGAPSAGRLERTLRGLKIRKSAGVRVTGAVHRLIRRGNAARGRDDWAAAADAYRAALERDPGLYHIWIQLGHALGEAGERAAADRAYAAAAGLRPAAAEAALYRGHLAKRTGDPEAAAAAYLAGARIGDAEAIDELHRSVSRLITIDRATLAHAARHEPTAEPDRPLAAAAEALRTAAGLLPEGAAGFLPLANRLAAADARTPREHASGPAMLFDISDLLAHFRHRRLPTGIQRVQIEVVLRALAADPGTRVCCFVDGREHLLEIPQPLFVELAHLSKAGKDEQAADWTDAIARLFIHLALVPPIAFRDGECLVNLGTSWWIHNYFLLLRNARAAQGVRLVAFVHDVIPLMAPEHCVMGVIQDYVGWLVGAVQHTDFFLANSESTARDFRRAATRLGHDGAALPIEVVPLDADFRSAAAAVPDRAELERWELGDKPFVLIVSTIESRKNHRLALDAWAELLREEGPDAVPQLVCVGRNGWLNDPVFARLAANPELKRRVTIIERVSDEELALLYGTCLFTLYPSLYEGWGLPVTESLCYGKLPVVADNSSLPEAGGDFALFFESGSIGALVAALRKAIDDVDWRIARERDIAARFVPRPWSVVADQILAAAARAAGQPARAAVAPTVELGRAYPVTGYFGAEVWPGLASGEMFRAGDGWLWPQADGCRTRPGGGSLAVGLPAGSDGGLRLYLRLVGLAEEDCPYRILIDGGEVRAGTIEAGANRWTTPIHLPAGPRERLEISVLGLMQETIRMVTGGTPKMLAASIGVAGFFLCREEDEAARAAFVEALALGAPERVDAYARPAERLAA